MSSPVLTISLAGREAVPVRALPFISPLSADEIAKELKGEAAGYGVRMLSGLRCYYLGEGSAVVEMSPFEWNRVLASLLELAADIRARFPDETSPEDHRGYAAWLRESARRLPARAFVWRDEYEAARRNVPIGWAEGQELNYMPLVSAEERSVVLEGFVPRGATETATEGPGPAANVLRRDLWTLLEAAQIAAGRNPLDHDVVGDNPHAVFRAMADDPALALVKELYARSKDAVQVGKLEHFETRTGAAGNIRVRPDDYIQWAQAAGFSVAVEIPNPASPSSEIVKRSVLVKKLRRSYRFLENALRANRPEFQGCRVPESDAPGGKQGYYYLEKVEELCRAKWGEGDIRESPTPIPEASSLAGQVSGIRGGRKFSG